MPVSIKVGCDPELFLRNKKSGKIVSAHDLLPGTKAEPFPVTSGAIQVDGTAAEFNINPSQSSASFVKNIAVVQGKLIEHLGPDYELVTEPVAVYDKDYFSSLPLLATELGCNPDFNAWTGTVNDPPDASGDLFGVRTASGHVHIGWTQDTDPNDPTHIMDCNMVVQELDYTLGLPSLMWDRDNRRRALYGKAGACRYKPYGVEYRVMSNKWLSDPRLQEFVWNTVYNTMTNMFAGQKRLSNEYGELAKDVINGNEKWWVKGHKAYPLMGRLIMPPEKYYTEPTPKADHFKKPSKISKSIGFDGVMAAGLAVNG